MGITYIQPSKLSGIWDDITSAYNSVKTNLTDVVIPYWSDATKAAISATVTKISDLTGWLSDADNNIAQANAILNSIPANQVTAQDKSMAANISAQQTSLVNKMNGISTDIQNGSQSGTDYQVQVSSNPADQSSGTFNVTTSLLPSGTSGLGILPLIVAGIAGVAITGTVVYEIYKLKNDSDQYLSYMQARAAAIKNGTPLPPLPPALAQYTTSSWVSWLLGGIVVAGIAGTIVYVKYFRKHESHVVYKNPIKSKYDIFPSKEHILYQLEAMRRIREKKGWSRHVSSGFIADEIESIKRTPTEYIVTTQDGTRRIPFKDFNLREVDELIEAVKKTPNSNPYHYSSRSRFTHHEIEPSSHFKPESIRTIKRHGVEFIIGRPKERYMGHTGYHGGATRAIAELVPR